MLSLCCASRLSRETGGSVDDLQCNLNSQICRNASHGDEISVATNSIYLQYTLLSLISCLHFNPRHLYALQLHNPMPILNIGVWCPVR